MSSAGWQTQPAAGAAVIDEDEEAGTPNIFASINVEDYERQMDKPAKRPQPVEPGPGGAPISGAVREDSGEESSLCKSGDGTFVIGLISRMGSALLKADSLDHMLDVVLNLVFDHVPAERGSIWVVEPGAGICPARGAERRG